MIRHNAILAALIALMAITAHAQRFQQEFGNPRKDYVEFVATPNHPDSRYQLGQTATLRIVAREGGRPLDGEKVIYRVGPEMLLPARSDTAVFVAGEATLCMGTMQDPGFLACKYEFSVEGKKYGDMVKVAYTPEQIKTFTPMPQDFDKFWSKTVAAARKVPLEPEYWAVADATDDKLETQLVRMHVGKDKWIFGYLTRPKDGKKHPVVLVPPGAGSNKITPSDYFSLKGFIYLKIEIHGNDPRLPDEEYNLMCKEKCDGYMRRGMESRDTYYYKDVYAGCVRAVDFLCSLPDWDGKNVLVTGGSQGGALTIITSALNEKVTMCAPFYPALCDLTGFLHHRAGGWPKFFSGLYDDSSVIIPTQQAEATLQYFDVVNFARCLNVPTFMSWGYSDDTCSPTSVWAAWNEISSEKQSDITPTSGHWRFTSSQNRCMQWIKRHLAPL